MSDAERRAGLEYTFDRHGDEYRVRFAELAAEMQGKCPVAWNDTYGGHWFAAGNQEGFDIARSADRVSSDQDVHNERRGYQGISIPAMGGGYQGETSFL